MGSRRSSNMLASGSRPRRNAGDRRHSALGFILASALAALIAPTLHRSLGFVSSLVSSGPIGSARKTLPGSTGRSKRLDLLARWQASFEVGDKVTAISPEDNVRYPGTFNKLNDDGTVEVIWDDPDGGPLSHPCSAKSLKSNKPKTASDFKVGDTVMAVSPDDEQTYPGVVGAINKDGTVQVKWDNPDGGAESHACKPETMEVYVPKIPLSDLKMGRKYSGIVQSVTDFGVFVDINAESDGLVFIGNVPKPPLKTGGFSLEDKVEAVFPEDSQWYTAVVTKVGTTTCQVKWDDPDGGPEVSDVKLEDMKHFVPRVAVQPEDEVDVWVERVSEDGKLGLSMIAPPDFTAFEGLPADQWLKGTIDHIVKFGFFVNVEAPAGGSTAMGLVHVSQIKDSFVDDPLAEGEVGQEVQVRVVKVDPSKQKMALSMLGPGQGSGGQIRRPVMDLEPFTKIRPDEWLKGKVVRTPSFGAFVEVTLPNGGPTHDGLVHITRISDGHIESVASALSIGQEVDVRIRNVDLRAKTVDLTMLRGDRHDGGGGGGGGGGDGVAAPRATADLKPFADFPRDQWIKGKVGRLASYGAFVHVTLPNGASGDGLVHITEIRKGFVEKVDQELSEGQEVNVLIKNVDVAKGQMALSMLSGDGGGGRGGGGRGGSREPVDLTPFANFPSDQWIKGIVKRTTTFGAFVSATLPDGGPSAEGLVHITQIKNGFVESVEAELSEGQEVYVWIKGVDTASGKMNLSMKTDAEE